MRRISIPIIVWVVSGLILVALMPLVAAWFQIDRNIGSIIEQTQQTHQIIASSSADRLDSRISLLQGLIKSAGDDPDVYLDPQSQGARDSIVALFNRMDGALSVTLFARRDGVDRMVYSARRPGFEVPDARLISPALDAVPDILLVQGQQVLRLQAQTSRPNLFVHALVEFDPLEDLLRPGVLTDASELLLVDRSGRVILGREGAFELLPQEVRSAMQLNGVVGANKSLRDSESPVVSGFSRVGSLPLNVVSLQPAIRAETARVEMRRTAVITFLSIAVAVLMLSAGAWFLVVRPIRRIVLAQQELTGNETGSGGEISQLIDSFERLEQAIRDRDELSEVFLGRYQVLRRIGSGAMGTVYLGWDPKLQRNIALKTIKFSDKVLESERRELTSRLLREGVSAARLTHPNVVTVYDVLGDERGAFLGMEYVEGPSLDDQVREEGPQSPELVRRVAEGVLRGLASAHATGLIHRDIKPGNVLLAKDGGIKVTDFGIAGFLHEAREKSRVVMGTPGYLAPEAYRTGVFDARTDLFALGVTLAECLIGDDVFPGRNTAQIIARTQARMVVLPDAISNEMPDDLAELLDALLEKSPEHRPGTAEEALEILGVTLDGLTGGGAAGGEEGASRPTTRRTRRTDDDVDQGDTARIDLESLADGDES